jgi:hypothetical protein
MGGRLGAVSGALIGEALAAGNGLVKESACRNSESSSSSPEYGLLNS